MKIKFLGAAATVTGSRTLVEVDHLKYLVDCGLFQGPKELRQRNWDPFPEDPASIEKIFLTHAHLDHSGYLPRLFKQGFRGEIWCTVATAALLEVILLDSARIHEEDADYANSTGYSNHKPALPLYNTQDARAVLKLVKPYDRDQWIQVDRRLSLRFRRAGHIVGASYIEMAWTDAEVVKRVTFSGDIGHDRLLSLRGPDPIEESDFLVLESTYGDRDHDRVSVLDLFAEVINKTLKRGGVLVIPAFAVGRAQEMLLMISLLERQGRIPKVPVILDSPMASKATEIYWQHPEEHPQNSAFHLQFSESEARPFLFEESESPDESMMNCMRDGPMIVVASSGMLSGGRILHHLKARLPIEKNTVLFAGYQAEGTKGRYLQDHAKLSGTLRIHHQEIPVNCEIATLPALSAHGDSEDLITWMSQLRRKPKKIVLNHGDPAAARSLKERLLKWSPIDVEIAAEGNTYKI